MSRPAVAHYSRREVVVGFIRAASSISTGVAMKNPYEVLRAKESELQQIQKEVEALRVTAQILEDDSDEQEQKTNLRQMVQLP
jgi:hypothetical protein